MIKNYFIKLKFVLISDWIRDRKFGY